MPSQSNQVLTMPLQQLVTQIKVNASLGVVALSSLLNGMVQMPDGSTDGRDKYPGKGMCSI